MANQEDELGSENQADGGETGNKKTTEEGSKDYKQIAEDQRKRAEKAEADLKALKGVNKEAEKPVENKDKINVQSSDPIEVAKIAAALTGLSEEAINQLSVIAKARGVSLAEAKKDPLFTAWFSQAEEVAKREKAKLGGSRGSSQGDEDKPVEGLAPDIHQPLDKQRADHMNAVKKIMGK